MDWAIGQFLSFIQLFNFQYALRWITFSLVNDSEFRSLFTERPMSFDLNKMVFDPIRGQPGLPLIDEDDDIDVF